MRKISLIAGAIALAAGLGAVSTASTAFAACLNPDAGIIDLSHNAMQPGAGWGYDKDAVDRELAKGNNCAVTPRPTRSRSPSRAHAPACTP